MEYIFTAISSTRDGITLNLTNIQIFNTLNNVLILKKKQEKNSQSKRESGLTEIQVDKIGKSKSLNKNDDEFEKSKPKTGN